MNTCKTCKHWESNQNMAHGVCLAANTKDIDVMQWRIPYQFPQYQPTHFFVSGSYGYDADLVVGPDFGCVHHSEKQT